MINPAQNLWMTPQINDYYCGPACLQYATKKLLGIEHTQQFLGEVARSTVNGTSHLGMRKAAEKMGFEVIETSDEGIQVDDYLNDNYVVIVGCTWGPDAEHYSILLERDDKFVTINDQEYIPMLYTMRREDFENAWHDTEYVKKWALILSRKSLEYNPRNNGKGLPAKRRIRASK